MYDVDDRDQVLALADVPRPAVGDPLPMLLADEGCVVLGYYARTGARPSADGDEPVAVLRFRGCSSHLFGAPNDEAFDGHPLASRGLEPYGVFEVKDSSWIRRLERMNAVHEDHRPEAFWQKRHLVFAFHDSTFECVCGGFDVRTVRGPMWSLVPTMLELLDPAAE